MTNPAHDRLLGVRIGILTGTASLELIAPAWRNLIIAARAQQEIDGLDYSMDVTMLRPDGSEIACRITCVMVQRADLLRFRTVTLHPELPPTLPAAASRAVAGRRIQLVGLNHVRQTLGLRWPALKKRAMATAERILRTRLGPLDTFSRTDDNGFVICFVGASEEDATFRAATIGREVRKRLIGDEESDDAAQVFSAATALPPTAPTFPRPRSRAL